MEKDPLLEKVHGYTRQALPLMSRHGVPTTPKNYTIWYNYVSGENPPLNNALDRIIETGSDFDEETSRDLYSRYCAEFDEAGLVRLQDGLSKLITALFSEARGFSGHTGTYERFLARSMAALSGASASDTLGEVIQKIIEETKSVIVYSKTLQQKLQETTRDLQTLKHDYEKAKKEASLDPLTGIANRKSFVETAEKALADADDRNAPLSLVMVDIDYFKQFNDTHGHLVGDEVLRFVASQIKSMIKGQDTVARLGGEEFVVLFPDTDHDGALCACHKIQTYFDKHALKFPSAGKALGNITLSLGLAQYRAGESLEDLIERSDKALYQAKEKGRNRVVSERDLSA